MRAEGSNGDILLFEDGIIIRRKGVMNVLTQGIQGDKRVPFASITAVQFRAAGTFMAGMIQFTIKGGREFRGGMLEATKDENAVLFTRDQQKPFEHIRNVVHNAIAKPSLNTNVNNTDELTKLADLVDRGFLTKDEFEERKRKILST